MKKGKKENVWLEEPEDHDFPAAKDYLELHFSEQRVNTFVELLKNAETKKKKAKDILRASGLPLLPETNIHVQDNIKKVKKGEKLSPVLLVRSEKLIIADGYHRVCSIYYLGEDLTVPCRLV